MSQLSFSSLDYATKKKLTKREVFLAEMPWGALETVIAPHYPAAPGPQGGRRAFPLAVMLRINGISFPIRVPKKRSTTFNRCARSQVSTSGAIKSPTRRRS